MEIAEKQARRNEIVEPGTLGGQPEDLDMEEDDQDDEDEDIVLAPGEDDAVDINDDSGVDSMAETPGEGKKVTVSAV